MADRRDTIDFGIDLGTTNSAVAVNSGGQVEVIKNNDGWDYTPSAVWVQKPGVVHVGSRARQVIERDPEGVALEFKLGMGFADAAQDFPRAGVRLSPPQLSAEVLKSLRADAAHRFGAAPEAAVITVPAAFALNQNNATSEAAVLAGFELPCPLVQEPTAAAFAYGFREASERAYWMVFDLGGGTFDAAVVSKRDGELQVLNHAGDPTLGGKLIDWAVVERLLAPALAKELGLADFRRDNPAWKVNFARLKLAAEDAKIALSRRDSYSIMVDQLDDGRGGREDFEYTLRREELDGLAEQYYERAISCCRNALAEGGLRPESIDRLLLVGGATLAPGLRERLADPNTGLGIELDFSQDPSTVVARGAALFASTVRVDRPLPVAAPGEFTAELVYEPSGTTLRPAVAGRLHSATPVDWTRYSVSLHSEDTDPPFHGPRIGLTAEGAFATEVVIPPNRTSRFTLELTDASGQPRRLLTDSLSITHSDVEFGGAVLTHSLGIGTANNTFVPLLRKNTTLPARAWGTFQTTLALNRSESESVIRIPVVEGERGRTNRNREVAMLQIRPVDVRIDLPAGSDVEVTLEVDKSRLVTVVADVPLGQTQVEAEVDLSNVTTPDPQELHQQLEEVETRLAKLRHEAPNEPAAQQHLAKMEREGGMPSVREDVRSASVDRNSALSAEQRLRDQQAELDDVEDSVRLPSLLTELREVLGQIDGYVAQSGREEDRTELDTLRGLTDTAAAERDSVAARETLDRARDFLFDLMRRSPDWDVTLFRILCGLRNRMPSDRADALVREGEQAISSGNRGALPGVNERLRRLIPPDVPDPVGWVTPSNR